MEYYKEVGITSLILSFVLIVGGFIYARSGTGQPNVYASILAFVLLFTNLIQFFHGFADKNDDIIVKVHNWYTNILTIIIPIYILFTNKSINSVLRNRALRMAQGARRQQMSSNTLLSTIT
tara:strand:+ start:430 stop:792 length:363 start_codon:yes stop_codon:yes gene_type:complete